jgi:tetratricopeptide (TPR) repeat protein
MIVWYLRLAVWPTKLCFDYGWPVYRTWHLLAPWCVLVGTALAVATYFGMRRRLAALPALMFFTLVAPTSSLIPCNELCTEHRMYAPLAPLCAVLSFAIARWLEWLAGSLEGLRRPSWRDLAFGLVIAALVVPLAAVTKARNACYDSRLALRIDTVFKATSNPRAHRMLACELAVLGRPKDALPFLRNAIELQPRYPLAYATLGQVFEALGQTDHAIDAYAHAAKLDPANTAVMSRLQVLKAATTGRPTAE